MKPKSRYSPEELAFRLGVNGKDLPIEYDKYHNLYEIGIEYSVIYHRFEISYNNMQLPMQHYQLLRQKNLQPKSEEILLIQLESIIQELQNLKEINQRPTVKNTFFIKRIGTTLEQRLDKLIDKRTKELTSLGLNPNS